MSTLRENTSQNFSENSKLTLQEMAIDYQSPSLHSEIASILKHVVTQSIAQMKVTPQVQNAEPTSDKDGRRKAEIIMSMEISISFQLPADCIVNKIDMDKVALSYQNFILPDMEGKVNLTHKFSFRERLEGWHLEHRQRDNGTYEVFYCHSKSRRMFRYITEVVNFLQYEIYYDNQNSKVKHISEEASTMKRKRETTSDNGIKRHEAFSGKQANDVEQSRKMITTKGQDFQIAAEKNAAETETTQIFYDNLMEEGESTVELQADGSLEEMLEVLKNAKIDQSDVKSELPDLHDISMDWAESDGLLDAYYDECELIYHVPICKSLDELLHFLITKRNERQG